MREILFRGKRLDNGEWIEGDLVQFPERGYVKIVTQNSPYCCAKVDPDTVGQYTGFIDKNGKKVFEDDVIYIGKTEYCIGKEVWSYIGKEIYEEREALVMFCFDAFIADFGMGNDYGDNEAPLIREIPMECTEVIYNIHDNPELLEADE